MTRHAVRVIAFCCAVAGGLTVAGCSSKPPPSSKSVGSCTPGLVAAIPSQAGTGQSIQVASFNVRCTPGRYAVDITMDGQFTGARLMGYVTVGSDGIFKGTVTVPKGITPGFARISVIANLSCTTTSNSAAATCTAGASGSMTVTP